MSVETTNDFHAMLMPALYMEDVLRSLYAYQPVAQTPAIHKHSQHLLAIPVGKTTLFSVCVGEIPPTDVELAGERLGVPRDRQFYYIAPELVAADIISRMDTLNSMLMSVRSNLQTNTLVTSSAIIPSSVSCSSWSL